MRFRVHTPTDKPRCLAIFDSTAERFFSEGDRQEFADYLDKVDEAYGVVADQSGRVIACGGFARRGPTAVLTWGVVEADRHGQGVGRFLLAQRLERIRALGDVLTVEMHTSGETVGFYEKAGFVVVRYTRDGYRTGLDRHDLELTLS